jgi:hypothetical protein
MMAHRRHTVAVHQKQERLVAESFCEEVRDLALGLHIDKLDVLAH